MRAFTLISLVVWSMLFQVKAQTKLNNDSSNIHQILLLQQTAWNHGNLDSFMMYYWQSPELTFVSKNGVSKGWQKVYDNYVKSYQAKNQMGVLDFGIQSIKLVDPNNAMVIGSWQVTNESGKHAGYFTLWFKKIKNKWVIIQDHTS